MNEKRDKYFTGHSNRVGVLLTCNPIRFDSTEPERLGKDEKIMNKQEILTRYSKEEEKLLVSKVLDKICLLYTSPSPRDCS